MAKRILILSSSPRKGRNSDTLCRRFLRELKKREMTLKRFSYEIKRLITARDAARVALHHKPCPQKDDAAEIIDKMVAADVIVMATPVYFYTMSAQMKTLIDRCCGLYTEMNDKEFYFIVTAAEDDKEKMMRTVDTFQGFLDCLENPTIKGVVFGLGVWHVGEIKGNPAMQEAYETGKRV